MYIRPAFITRAISNGTRITYYDLYAENESRTALPVRYINTLRTIYVCSSILRGSLTKKKKKNPFCLQFDWQRGLFHFPSIVAHFVILCPIVILLSTLLVNILSVDFAGVFATEDRVGIAIIIMYYYDLIRGCLYS